MKLARSVCLASNDVITEDSPGGYRTGWGFPAQGSPTQSILRRQKRIQVMYSARNCLPILIKTGMCRHILIKLHSIKFNGDPFCSFGAVLCGHVDRYGEAKRRMFVTKLRRRQNEEKHERTKGM
jgi:hypothetical protein